ncbi:MAG: TonB-dependent receptor [Pseudomonadota bacterium]
MEWTDLPLAIDDIDRIEVIRGPNAATHGSNSFLGVINIITQDPIVVPDHTLRISKGSNGIEDALYRHGSSGEQLDYRLTLDYMADDGFDDRHDSKIVRMVNLAANHQLNLQDRLEVQLGYSAGPRAEGFSNDPFQELNTTRKRSHFEQLRWRRIATSDDEWSLQFSHNYDKLIETRAGTMILPVNANGTPERFDLELYRTRRHGKDLRAVWGLGARRDEITSTFYFGNADTRSNGTYRMFGNLEWRLATPLLLNLGAMWEYTDISGDTLSPRLALNYRLSPTQTLRSAVSQAYRTPVFFEQDADLLVPLAPPAPPGTLFQGFKGLGNLDPERIRSVELGYIGEFPATHLTLDLRLYRDSMDNLITQADYPGALPSPLPTTQTFINYDSAIVTGFESELQWRPAPGNLLMVSYAWADVNSDSPELKASSPRHTLSLLGSHRFNERCSGSAAWYYTDDQLWLGDGDRIPAYHRVDLRLAYAFRLGGKSAELSGVVQNLFGDYRDFLYRETDPQKRNEFDTRGWLSLRLEF